MQATKWIEVAGATPAAESGATGGASGTLRFFANRYRTELLRMRHKLECAA